MKSLSVVVIGRNEEARIAECLRSVITAAAQVGVAEIVMVDSASDDRTVEIARSCGVRVVSLKSDSNVSASAGRFVGFHKTQGDLVMFVDGDTVINREWFSSAIPYFAEDHIAGVMGDLNDLDAQGMELPYVGPRNEKATSCPWFRGIGMYRRSAMNEVGTFNPYLKEEEEAELAFRLTRQGWQLLSVPEKMGSHLRGTSPLGYLLRRFNHRGFMLIGQTLRYAVYAGNGTEFIFRRCRRAINFAVAALALVAGTTFALMGHRSAAAVMFVMLVIGSVAIAIKKRTLMGPIIYIADNSLILLGLLVGFFTAKVKDPNDYPLDAADSSR